MQSASGPAAETPELQAVAADLFASGLPATAVAEQVFDAVREQRLYQITTPSYDDAIRQRAEAILARRNPEFPDLLDLSTRDRRRVS